MSASLVGSEMCIRDRAAQKPEAGQRAPLGWRCLDAAERPFEIMMSTVVAVSYTHLTLPTICSV
eukprot:13366278-Alexandrium_andersonii.AAC.1